MVIMSSDVTEEIKHMTEQLVEKGIYKSQSEVVRDAIRQLAYKYGVSPPSHKEARAITGKAKRRSGETLSAAVRRVREESA